MEFSVVGALIYYVRSKSIINLEFNLAGSTNQCSRTVFEKEKKSEKNVTM